MHDTTVDCAMQTVTINNNTQNKWFRFVLYRLHRIRTNRKSHNNFIFISIQNCIKWMKLSMRKHQLTPSFQQQHNWIPINSAIKYMIMENYSPSYGLKWAMKCENNRWVRVKSHQINISLIESKQMINYLKYLSTVYVFVVVRTPFL